MPTVNTRLLNHVSSIVAWTIKVTTKTMLTADKSEVVNNAVPIICPKTCSCLLPLRSVNPAFCPNVCFLGGCDNITHNFTPVFVKTLDPSSSFDGNAHPCCYSNSRPYQEIHPVKL